MQCSTSQVSAGQLRCPAPQQRASGHCRAWTTSRTNRHGASSTPQLHVPRAVQQSLSQAPQQSHPQSQRGSARSNKPAPLPEVSGRAAAVPLPAPPLYPLAAVPLCQTAPA